MLLQDCLTFKLIIVLSLLIAVVKVIVVEMLWADVVSFIVVRSTGLVDAIFIEEEAVRVIKTAIS
jgi:hypothetical protein